MPCRTFPNRWTERYTARRGSFIHVLSSNDGVKLKEHRSICCAIWLLRWLWFILRKASTVLQRMIHAWLPTPTPRTQLRLLSRTLFVSSLIMVTVPKATAADSINIQSGLSFKMFSASTEAKAFSGLLPLGVGIRINSFTRRTFMVSGAVDANLSSSDLSLVLLSFSARAHYFLLGGAPINKKDLEKKILFRLKPQLGVSLYAELGAATFNFSQYEVVLPPGAPKPVDAKDSPRGSLYAYGGGISVRYTFDPGFSVALEGGANLTLNDPAMPNVTLFGGSIVFDLPI